jgi:hypothetical protein
MTMAAKPALPNGWAAPIERIHVDQSNGSDFREILRIATLAADTWSTGPDGPYKQPGMTLAQISQQQVAEALLQLLELGLIDIDSERLTRMLEDTGIPIGR